MKTSIPVLAALLLALPAVMHAQVIRGVVVDEQSNAPIGGVAVDALRRGSVVASGLTDDRGAILLNVRAQGRYSLRLSHPSYLDLTTEEVEVLADTLQVEVRLDRTSIPLRPVVVAAEVDPRMAGFQARMARGGFGQFLTRERIDSRPGARTTDLLREMSGVSILPVNAGAGRRVNMIRMRGGTSTCDPTIYVDGIVMRQFIDSPIDDLLKPEQIAGVEVYSSGAAAPPPVTSRDHCGVVAFWTRPVENLERFSLWRIVAGGVAVLGLFTIILITR